MSLLFSPYSVRDTVFRNRLWVSPMCQYSAVDGVPQEWHHTHLTQFASGGAGLVFAEATAVSPEGRISPEDTGIFTDEQRDAWAPIAAAIVARGAVPGIQLAHAGRKASTWSPLVAERGSVPIEKSGWTTVAPSPIAYEGLAAPAELDRNGIEKVVADFAAAARRSVEAGFKVLEIHAAHGYLLHEYLSPLTNTRCDGYGGSLKNRARLLLRVVDAVRSAAPGIALFVRFSASDGADGGWNVSDTAIVARWAADLGADFFDISSGGLVKHQRIAVAPGYQVGYAAHVRREANVPVNAVGLIHDAVQAESILARGDADAIMAGREWLRDPHFALRAAADLGVDIDYWPAQYAKARPIVSIDPGPQRATRRADDAREVPTFVGGGSAAGAVSIEE